MSTRHSPTQKRKAAGQPARDKKAKFIELATNRVNRTLKDLALIANLANRRNYEYTDEQAKKVIRALQAGLDQVKAKFATDGSPNKSEFEL